MVVLKEFIKNLKIDYLFFKKIRNKKQYGEIVFYKFNPTAS